MVLNETSAGSNLSESTIRDSEEGRRISSVNNLAAIRRAMEEAGMTFLGDGEAKPGGPGVRVGK